MMEKKFVCLLLVTLTLFSGLMSKAVAAEQDLNSFTCPITGAEFILIPAGTFTMGSPPTEPGREKSELQHQVAISKPFYMQKTELTQGQWQKIMGNNPAQMKKCGPDCPVDKISWHEVQEFIKKLNQLAGGEKYRLPTEAEWEYSARAGTTTPFYTGQCLSTNQANYNGQYPYKGCPEGEYRNKPLPVGKFPPNAWGLYNMSDNVWEWVQDWYGDYPPASVTDPQGPPKGKGRVVRGGSWYDGAGFCRSATRSYYGPEVRDAIVGFRLVRIP